MPRSTGPDSARQSMHHTIDPKKLTDIRGFEFSPTMPVKDFVKNFHYLGFQASNLSQGVDVVREMVEDECHICLSADTHTGTSGLRDMIAQLIRDKKITCLVASVQLIEEDILKTFFSFKLGEFDTSEEVMKANKITRAGNIFIPNEYDSKFEAWHHELIQTIHKENKSWPAHEYVKRLGAKLKDENSIVYWAAKRNVNIFVPDISSGRMVAHWSAFNKTKNQAEKLIVDNAASLKVFNEHVSATKKIGAIILDADISKNILVHAAKARGGLDYTIFVRPGISAGTLKGTAAWDMLKNNKKIIPIDCDATIALPLLMTGFYS